MLLVMIRELILMFFRKFVVEVLFCGLIIGELGIVVEDLLFLEIFLCVGVEEVRFWCGF